MDSKKRARLERAGWKIGTASDFLGLSPEESALVDIRLRLARAVAEQRKALRLTQAALAKRIGSSQSRVAKAEAGDPTVSIDLLVKTLLALGESVEGVATAIARAPRRTQKRSRKAQAA
jgi:DNA-binding XRE family transcriptional regulator